MELTPCLHKAVTYNHVPHYTAGSETHFRVVVVSEYFNDVPLIKVSIDESSTLSGIYIYESSTYTQGYMYTWFEENL